MCVVHDGIPAGLQGPYVDTCAYDILEGEPLVTLRAECFATR